jgi:hypothetical protein
LFFKRGADAERARSRGLLRLCTLPITCAGEGGAGRSGRDGGEWAPDGITA